MKLNAHKSPPVVLVVDGDVEYNSLKNWLAKSPFSAYEAADVIDAVGELCDFTKRDLPNVVLLPVNSLRHEFDAIERMMDAAIDPEMHFPVFSYSLRTTGERSISDLKQLDIRLTKLFPTPALKATAQ